MFVNTSMTGTGIAAFIVVAILKWLGIDIDSNIILQAIVNLVGFFSVVLMVWGQLRRKDLRWGFWRK